MFLKARSAHLSSLDAARQDSPLAISTDEGCHEKVSVLFMSFTLSTPMFASPADAPLDLDSTFGDVGAIVIEIAGLDIGFDGLMEDNGEFVVFSATARNSADSQSKNLPGPAPSMMPGPANSRAVSSAVRLLGERQFGRWKFNLLLGCLAVLHEFLHDLAHYR